MKEASENSLSVKGDDKERSISSFRTIRRKIYTRALHRPLTEGRIIGNCGGNNDYNAFLDSANDVNGFETLTSSRLNVEQQFCGLYFIYRDVSADGAARELSNHGYRGKSCINIEAISLFLLKLFQETHCCVYIIFLLIGMWIFLSFHLRVNEEKWVKLVNTRVQYTRVLIKWYKHNLFNYFSTSDANVC